MEQYVQQAVHRAAAHAHAPPLDFGSRPATATPPRPAPPQAPLPRVHGRRFFTPAASLVREWDALASRTAAPPYVQPGWIEAWWQAFGSGEPELRTYWHGSRLAAVLPMMRQGGLLRSAANYHTPGFGMVAEDAAAAEALAFGLFADLPAQVSLTSVDVTDAGMKACERAARMAGYRVLLQSYQRSPYIELKGGWEDYEPNLAKNMSRNLRRGRRRLEREGRLSVERCDSGTGLESLLEEAFNVEASGWKGAGHTAIQSNRRTREFYTDVAHWAAARGMLQLYFLRLDGQAIAMYYALMQDGVCHLLKGGYDPSYRRYSPGNLLMQAVIHDCCVTGMHRVELNGDADAYKFAWAATVHERKRLVAFAPTLAGRRAWFRHCCVRPVTARLRHVLGTNPGEDA